jgi:hypothetical protein
MAYRIRRIISAMSLLRAGILTLPALLLVSSGAATVLALPAWGAGVHVGLPDWMPTVAGLVIGLPGAVTAVICLSRVWRTSNEAFSVVPMLLLFGLLTLPIAIATETAVAVSVADPATYNRLLEPEPVPPGFPGAPQTAISPASFLAGTVVISLFVHGVVALAATVYASAITVELRRFDRARGEVDAIDELIRGRQGPRTPLT